MLNAGKAFPDLILASKAFYRDLIALRLLSGFVETFMNLIVLRRLMISSRLTTSKLAKADQKESQKPFSHDWVTAEISLQLLQVKSFNHVIETVKRGMQADRNDYWVGN